MLTKFLLPSLPSTILFSELFAQPLVPPQARIHALSNSRYPKAPTALSHWFLFSVRLTCFWRIWWAVRFLPESYLSPCFCFNCYTSDTSQPGIISGVVSEDTFFFLKRQKYCRYVVLRFAKLEAFSPCASSHIKISKIILVVWGCSKWPKSCPESQTQCLIISPGSCERPQGASREEACRLLGILPVPLGGK